jgi:hypothetical protein
MKIITAPEPFNKDELELPSLFLAGGITNCKPWQNEVLAKLTNFKGTVFNPRREVYPDDPKTGTEQIEWEFNALQCATIISFWFCADTLCPITLFELGVHLTRSRFSIYPFVLIGIEPNYARDFDVRTQAKLIKSDMQFYTSLDALTEYLKKLLR